TARGRIETLSGSAGRDHRASQRRRAIKQRAITLEESVQVAPENEVRVDRHIPWQLSLNTETKRLRVGKLDGGVDQHRVPGDSLEEVRSDHPGGAGLIEQSLKLRSLLRQNLQRLRGGQLRRQNLKRGGVQRRAYRRLGDPYKAGNLGGRRRVQL